MIIINGTSLTVEQVAAVARTGEQVAISDEAKAAGVFHFGEITIPELKKYLSESGIPVRR